MYNWNVHGLRIGFVFQKGLQLFEYLMAVGSFWLCLIRVRLNLEKFETSLKAVKRVRHTFLIKERDVAMGSHWIASRTVLGDVPFEV